MKHVFIINSQCSKRQQQKLKEDIQSTFATEDYQIEYTTYKGHAKVLASMHAQKMIPMRIYACGGDGTVHEVVNGILPYAHVQLGILPIGTGNDFVKAFPALTRHTFLTLQNYQQAHCIPVDVIMVDDQASINTVSAGLDVHVTYHVDKFKHLPFAYGSLPYYLGLLVSMAGKIWNNYALKIDGNRELTDDFLFVVVGNGRCYGGGYCPTPDAKVDDGWLDYSLIRKVSRRKILLLSKKYKKGTHTAYSAWVQSGRLKSLQILTNGLLIRLNLDGELYETSDPIIHIEEKKILLALPVEKKAYAHETNRSAVCK